MDDPRIEDELVLESESENGDDATALTEPSARQKQKNHFKDLSVAT